METEARAYLGDLTARLKRPEQGLALMTKVLQERPDSARAAVGLGMLHLRENRIDDALAVLKLAAERAPRDAAVQGAYGRALLTRSYEEQDRDARNTLVAEARAALARAIDVDPTSVMPVALLGYTELQIGSDLPRAISLLEKAAQLAPAREQYRLMLAEAFMRQRDFTRASSLLGPLLAFGRTKETRNAARQRLGIMSEMQKRIRDAEARVANAANTPGTPTVPAAAELDLVPRTSLMSVLEPDGTRTPTDPAPPGTPTSISCGVFGTPSRVLATHRALQTAAAGVDGQVVAVELIPDGYTPRSR
jgi:cytochrome c-type biogenesis protein CcmH/NrfG